MRKLFIFLGIAVISLVLVGCNGTSAVVTPPTYTGITVESTNPLDGTEFVTFYRAKYETVLVEVGVNNPDNVTIKSIVVNGITFNSHRFTEASDNSTIYFEMSVGTVIGATTYSIDRISYLDGENTYNVEGFSNNEFEIYVYKEAPSVERENYLPTKNSITIDLDITDDDNVIVTDTLVAKLYSGETLIDQVSLTKGLVTVEFTGLLTNKHYEVKVEASYDLLDGAGLVSNFVMYSGTYSTVSNGLPSATISNTEVSSNSVLLNVEFVDVDEVVVDGTLRVEIYNDGIQLAGDDYTKVISGSTGGLSFDGLLNNNEYTVKVVSNYNLNDGTGITEDNVLAVYVFTTLPRSVPSPQLTNLNLQENSIEFDVVIDDPLGIIDDSTIVANLYIEDVFVDASEVNDYHVDFQINNLFSDYDFRIELVADYDLNDGEGVQPDQVIYDESFSTLENAVPSVIVEGLLVEQGYLTVTLEVSDFNETLIGSLWAVLYEEDTEVGTIYFDTETNELVFDYPTEAGLSYYVEIFADYNLRDGIGAYYDQSLRRIVSFTAEAKAPIAEVKNVVTDNSSISFDVTVIDADETIEAGTIMVYLYHLDTIVDSTMIAVGDDSIVFNTNILSNNEYNIVIDADFNLDDGSGILVDQELITQTVNTTQKALPTANVENLETTDESITFDIEILDVDDVVIVGSIAAELFLEGVSQEVIILAEGENFGVTFDTGIKSDNNYKVVVTLDYNLNDGTGTEVDSEVKEIIAETQPKAVPSAEFVYTESDENEITLDIYVTDEFDVISPATLQAVLYLNDTAVVGVLPIALTEGLNTDVIFSNLYSNERYYINVEAVYDLNDGDVDLNPQVLYSNFIKTGRLEEPVAVVANISASISTITFDVQVTDLDGVIDANLEAVVYLGDVVITSEPIVLGETLGVSLSGLDSEIEYVIKIEADYDLNEESGPVLDGELYTNTLATKALSAPSADIIGSSSDTESISVNVVVDNGDGTITGNRIAKLYKDDVYDGQEVVLFDNTNFDVEFVGLVSDAQYEVRVFVDYDLNDAAGPQTDMLMDIMFVSTRAKMVPIITVDGMEVTKTAITFDYELNDLYNVLEPGAITASLYNSLDELQASKTLGGDNISFNLSGFLSGETLEIRITGNYDLNDGVGVQTSSPIDTIEFTTNINEIPAALIDELIINQNDVSATIVITDSDNIIVGDLKAVIYDDLDAVVATYTGLTVGENNFEFSANLEYGRFYSVVVLADYDLLDGGLVHDDVDLTRAILGINNKKLPQSLISNVVIGSETIDFEVDLYDNDDVITDTTTYAKLYLDGVYVDEIQLLNDNNPGLQFVGLYSAREYEIRISTGYNNDNGNGFQTNYLMETESYITEAKQAPTAKVEVDDITSTSIQFDVIISDLSGVAGVSEAVLYDEYGVQIGLPINLPAATNINLVFSGLSSDTIYEIAIEIDYDLNEGTGSTVEEVMTESFNTIPNVAPNGEITTVSSTDSTVSVVYDFQDEDSVGTTYLNVYEEAVLVKAILLTVDGVELSETITGLDPYRNYTIKMESTYDLQNLDGVQLATLGEELITTTTIISVVNETTDKVSDVLEIEVIDVEEILVDGVSLVATLRQYNSEEFTTYIIGPDGQITIEMLNLLSNNDYILEIEATFNTDGVAPETAIVYSHEFTTLEMEVTTVSIDTVTAWVSAPDLTVLITVGVDLDNTAVDSSWAAYLYQDDVLVSTYNLYDNNGSSTVENVGTQTVVFVGYDHTDGSAYTVVVRADIDPNEFDALDPLFGPQEETIAQTTFVDALN